jgi:hypothetical protein
VTVGHATVVSGLPSKSSVHVADSGCSPTCLSCNRTELSTTAFGGTREGGRLSFLQSSGRALFPTTRGGGAFVVDPPMRIVCSCRCNAVLRMVCPPIGGFVAHTDDNGWQTHPSELKDLALLETTCGFAVLLATHICHHDFLHRQ